MEEEERRRTAELEVRSRCGVTFSIFFVPLTSRQPCDAAALSSPLFSRWGSHDRPLLIDDYHNTAVSLCTS